MKNKILILALVFAGALFANDKPAENPTVPAPDVTAITKERDELKKQLAESSATSQETYLLLQTQRNNATARMNDLEATLALTQHQLQAVTKERDELKAKVAELEKPKTVEPPANKPKS
jgi:septal ring factor EnvC (AmiA/AmiB activator)